MVPDTKLKAAQGDDVQQNVPYHEIIGILLHLPNTCRPDIAYSMGYHSRILDKFGMEHWKAAKRVLRYLKGTCSLLLVYSKTSAEITGYSDAYFAANT